MQRGPDGPKTVTVTLEPSQPLTSMTPQERRRYLQPELHTSALIGRRMIAITFCRPTAAEIAGRDALVRGGGHAGAQARWLRSLLGQREKSSMVASAPSTLALDMGSPIFAWGRGYDQKASIETPSSTAIHAASTFSSVK